MSCSRYSDALNEIAAGGLASLELKEHLDRCQGCRKELVMLEQMLAIADEVVGGLAAQEPSPGFMNRIHAAVGESPRSLPAHRAWFQPLLVTAAVLVIALAFVLKWHPTQAPLTTAYTPVPERAASELPAERAADEVVAINTAHEAEAPSVQRPDHESARAQSADTAVLVPAGESHALMEVIALVNMERLVPDGLSAAGDPSPNLAAPTPISISPIEIGPLESDISLGT